MKIKLLLVLFLSLLFICPTFSTEEKKVVRVAISNQNFSNYNHQNIKIASTDNIKIIDMSQNIQLDAVEPNDVVEIFFCNGTYSIKINDIIKYENLIGPILLSSNSDIQLLELNRKGAPARYKGMIEICLNKYKTAFNVINIIDMQNYLRGVVPNEMPLSFGLEALKAQSVAARNYATNAKINPNYDVVDSTASQVYYGVNSYKDLTDDAVNRTNGIYAIYNEEPITALYFSTSTGITDDWDDVFGNGEYSGKHPYLKARYDYKEKPLKDEKDMIEFLSKTDNGFDINSPKFRWNYEFDRIELEEVLHKTLQQQSKTGLVEPSYDGDIKLEGLKEIRPLKRTQSGKIIELQIISKTGDYKVKSQLGIRRVFRKNGSMLPSSSFYVSTSGKEKMEEKEDEDRIKIFDFSSDDKFPQKFEFIGGGFGHGVGMSQYGASNLAKNGKNYPEILNHYYSDIKISTMAKQVEYNNYNVSSKTEFYFEPKIFEKAYLYINNQRRANEFPFKINEYEFSDTQSIAKEDVIKINITEYLKEGMNVVEFLPLTSQNKNRYIIYRVEFQ